MEQFFTIYKKYIQKYPKRTTFYFVPTIFLGVVSTMGLGRVHYAFFLGRCFYGPILYFNFTTSTCYRTKKSHKDLAKFIRENEVIVRHCYAEIIPFSSESFVKMILLDSIFIIKHFWRTKQTWPKSCVSNDTSYSHKCEWKMGSCVFSCQKEQGSPNEDNKEMENREDRENQEKEYPWLSYNILQDLILLENQVPFFVLEELYNSSYRDLSDDQNKGRKDEDNSFLNLVIHYFLYHWKDSGLSCSSDYKKILSDKKEVRHFNDLLRYFLLPPDQKLKRGKSIKRLPCATKLAEAGVEFREVKNRPLLDIRFHKSGLLQKFPCLNFSWLLSCFPCFKCLEKIQPVLELQAFVVGDATECVIRNLMALEQCHYPREAYICNYIVLLDHLINTAEDVDLLVEKKVIVNWLGSNKIVANLINKLSHQIVEADHSHYILWTQ
jgi:hypothetical protein